MCAPDGWIDRAAVAANFGLARAPVTGASSDKKSEEVDLRMPVGECRLWGVVDSNVASKRSRGEPGFEFAGLTVVDATGDVAALTAGE